MQTRRPRRSALVTSLIALTAALAAVVMAPAQAVAATAPSTYSTWTMPSGGGTYLSQYVYVVADGGGASMQYGSQFTFNGKKPVRGYIGLDTRGRTATFTIGHDGTPFGLERVGSLATDGAGKSYESKGSNPGFTMQRSVNWQKGRWYQLFIGQGKSGPHGMAAWDGWIRDAATTNWIHIGSIAVTGHTGTLSRTVSSVSYQAAGSGSCRNRQSAALFHRPESSTGLPSSHRASHGRASSAGCDAAAAIENTVVGLMGFHAQRV